MSTVLGNTRYMLESGMGAEEHLKMDLGVQGNSLELTEE
jgi:hypothetical protein